MLFKVHSFICCTVKICKLSVLLKCLVLGATGPVLRWTALQSIMTVVLLVISVEAGNYYYRGYEFIELKSVEGAACKFPGIPSLSL